MLRKINWLKDGNGSAKVAARHLGKTKEFCEKFWPYAKYFDAVKYPKYAEYIDKEISSIVSQWETEEQILKSRIKHNTTAIQDWLDGERSSINLWGHSFDICAHNNAGLMLKALLGYIIRKKLKTPKEIRNHLMDWFFTQPKYLCFYMPPYGDYLFSDSPGYYADVRPKKAFETSVLMRDVPEDAWKLFKQSSRKLIKASVDHSFPRYRDALVAELPLLPKDFLAGSKSPYFAERARAHMLRMRPAMRILPYMVSPQDTGWLTAQRSNAADILGSLGYLPEGYLELLISPHGLALLRMQQLSSEQPANYSSWFWKSPRYDALSLSDEYYTESFNVMRELLKGN